MFISLTDVAAAHICEDELAQLRRPARAELAHIAAWPDGLADLVEFNTRARGRIAETRRNLAKFVNSPPELGPGGTLSNWVCHLDRLAETAAFRTSVTLKPELAKIDKLLAGDRNIWRDALRRWKLLERPTGLTCAAKCAAIFG